MTVAEDAQRLVDEEAIVITSQSEFSISGLVNLGEWIYQPFIMANGHFFCTCDWGQNHSNTDDLCAHALAVKLAVERGRGDEA